MSTWWIHNDEELMPEDVADVEAALKVVESLMRRPTTLADLYPDKVGVQDRGIPLDGKL